MLVKKLTSGNRPVRMNRNSISHATMVSDGSVGRAVPSNSRLVTLRHHPSVWFLPAGLLILALLPWPYGYYNFLRLTICALAGWLAYTQWTHDNALSGWVVALGATSLLYNPFLPVYMTREIWTVLDVLSAGLFVAHFCALRQLAGDRPSTATNDRNRELRAMTRPKTSVPHGVRHNLMENRTKHLPVEKYKPE